MKKWVDKKIICFLFFLDGKNCYGNINDYLFDILMDVYGI